MEVTREIKFYGNNRAYIKPEKIFVSDRKHFLNCSLPARMHVYLLKMQSAQLLCNIRLLYSRLWISEGLVTLICSRFCSGDPVKR